MTAQSQTSWLSRFLKLEELDRLRSVRLKLRRGLVKLTMCSAVGLVNVIKNKKIN